MEIKLDAIAELVEALDAAMKQVIQDKVKERGEKYSVTEVNAALFLLLNEFRKMDGAIGNDDETILGCLSYSTNLALNLLVGQEREKLEGERKRPKIHLPH